MKKNCEALIIGGSAGSLDVLLKTLPKLHSVLSFPIILVLHRKPGQDSLLTELLKSRTKLQVKEAEEKEKILPSTIYIAPPNYHLLIEKDRTFSLDASEKVNFSRPAIDVTLENAADVYGENLVALLLSGSNTDGTVGLKTVKEHGGTILVQHPESATSPFMPENAARNSEPDAILQIEEMPNYINQLSE
ncbi:chemotaxis protein CheB [Chryseobacterium suipulveris]|uniref:protein-glutamate methylesterase n=1 Tax=Chryseobacterium suipulveris TaxID=2929800 RepID=A0ABY4BS51_9FLAO|nr:chemotaxis protein CheB [Chryseobacterium suipulveris]UOE42021.1 chemotaxis protein CheB [Chryseobacterium suipulveris]